MTDMKKEFSILFFLLFVAANSFGQEEKIYTNNGNKSLQAGNYEEAEKAYKKALRRAFKVSKKAVKNMRKQNA